MCLSVIKGDGLWGFVCVCVSEAELVENINSFLAALLLCLNSIRLHKKIKI